MDRIIDAIEWCAATFVGIVALNIFLAVVLRKFFAWQIPDSYDIGKMLLGTLIFWGIAATSYRGSHITVDLLWTRGERALEALHRRLRDDWCCCSSSRCRRSCCSTRCARPIVDHVLTYDLNMPDLAVLRASPGSATRRRWC